VKIDEMNWLLMEVILFLFWWICDIVIEVRLPKLLVSEGRIKNEKD
jgi:hypothetical protein